MIQAQISRKLVKFITAQINLLRQNGYKSNGFAKLFGNSNFVILSHEITQKTTKLRICYFVYFVLIRGSISWFFEF